MWNLEKTDPLKLLHSVSIWPARSFVLPSTFSLILGLCVPQGCLYLFYLVLLTLLLDFLANVNSCKEKASLRCCLLNAIAP